MISNDAIRSAPPHRGKEIDFELNGIPKVVRRGGIARSIGLVGAIGAGKTTVAAHLAALGAVVVDGDAIGHETLTIPGVVIRLQELFGERILGADGAVDRRALGRIVFAAPAEMTKLEAVVHPFIRGTFDREIERARGDATFAPIVLDAAVLLEAGWNDLVDEIVFIDADRKLREERVRARGWSAGELARREAAQWPLERKRTLADHVIVNDEKWDECRSKIDALFQSWLAAPAEEPLAAERLPGSAADRL